MNFDEYQQLAQRTAKDTTRTHKLMECALGLAGESGEVADHIKKHLYQGHDLSIDHIKGELGDVLWYVATMARALGLDLSEVASANVAKLKARYPDGFDPKRSRDRGDGLLGDDQAEDVTKAALDDTTDHAALFEAHPLPWKVYVDPDPPTAMAAVFVDDANDDPICDASSITGEDWHSMAFARFVVDAVNKYADSQPKQPVEPHKPPIAIIDDGPPCSLAEANVAKLKARYPDGFDPKRSRDRGDGLLGDDQAVEAAKAVVVDREVVEADGVRWVRMSGKRSGGVWQATWLAIDDERVKLHRVGSTWTLKRGDVSYGVFDSSGIATVYAARKALRWAAVRLNTPGWDNDFKDSLPKQPIEPSEPPTVTIPSERLELEERMREHMKSHRVVVKGGTD